MQKSTIIVITVLGLFALFVFGMVQLSIQNRTSTPKINYYYEDVNLFGFHYQNGFVSVNGNGYIKYLNNSNFDFVGIFPQYKRITFLSETPTDSKFYIVRGDIVKLLGKSEDVNLDKENNFKYYRVWTISENEIIVLSWSLKNELVLQSQEM